MFAERRDAGPSTWDHVRHRASMLKSIIMAGTGDSNPHHTKHRYARLVSRRSFVGAGVAAFGAATAIAIPAGCQGQFYPGTSVLEFNLGGKSLASAEGMLRQRLSGFEQKAIIFEHQNKSWTASLADLGYRIDYAATLSTAFQHGRDRGVLARYSTWFDAGGRKQVFPLAFERNDATLTSYLAGLGNEVAVSAVDAKLVQNGTKVDVQADIPGSQLNAASVRATVDATVQTASTETVPLAMVPVTANITASKLSPVREAAAKLLDGPVTIVAGSATWSVDPDTLASALVIPDDPATQPPTLNPDALVAAISDIATSLAIDPVNAIVGWDNGPYAIEKGKYGQKVDPAALASAVVAAALRENRTAQVPLTDVIPTVRSDNLGTLGLAGLIAAGDSSFEGSSEARSTNVQVAARHISATLIPPGAQFSFNNALGQITTANGYVEGKIIKGEWYASDLGGGVCQVSTTVYRAALKAGVKFDEWHPHSFRVSFYELDGWPPGIDAAIYQPNSPDEWEMDLKFTNSTDAWMLLQMVEDSGHVTAQFYGAPKPYDVKLDKPTISPPIAPPAPIQRKTADLPAGQKKQAQVAAPGYKVVLTRSFLKGTQVVDQDTFVSEYDPQAEVWDIGTGSQN